MRRNTIIFYQLALDFRIDIPFTGLVSPEVAEYKLCTLLRVILAIVFSNHLGTMARFVVRVILSIGVNHTHIKSHLAGVVSGDEHLCLLFGFRKWRSTEYCGVTTLGKLHQLLNERLLRRCRRDIVENLVLHWSIHSNFFGGTVIGDLIVESSQLRHLDEEPEAFLLDYMICDVELKISSLLGEDCSPCVEAPNILPFKLIRTKILEQQIQFSKRVTDCRSRQECRSEVFACVLLNGTNSIEKIQRSLRAFRITKTRHAVMPGVEHQVLELMRFVHKDVVDTHLLEVNDSILVLLHLILYGGNLRG